MTHLATHLATLTRNQRPHHDDTRCDAFDLCAECREATVLVRRARIPQQRKAST